MEKVANSQILDIDVLDLYSDRYYNENNEKLVYGLLLQIHAIETIKTKIERLHNFRMITNGIKTKEGDTE